MGVVWGGVEPWNGNMSKVVAMCPIRYRNKQTMAECRICVSCGGKGVKVQAPWQAGRWAPCHHSHFPGFIRKFG